MQNAKYKVMNGKLPVPLAGKDEKHWIFDILHFSLTILH